MLLLRYRVVRTVIHRVSGSDKRENQREIGDAREVHYDERKARIAKTKELEISSVESSGKRGGYLDIVNVDCCPPSMSVSSEYAAQSA